MRSWISAFLAVVLVGGCDGNGNNGNGDAGPTYKIEDLPIDDESSLAGLEGAVDVVFDNRGMPHIYATTDHDVLMVQGYLMARDRAAQMEFLRRGVEGRLAEVAYSLAPSLADMDRGARQAGYARMAQAILDDADPGDPVIQAMRDYSEGVNAYFAKLRDGSATLPSAFLAGILRGQFFTDWEPRNILSIARYMTYDLSKTASSEIRMTESMAAIAEEFPSDSPDPRLAARASMLHDIYPFAPAENAFTIDALPNLGSDSGTRAGWDPSTAPPTYTPARVILRGAREFFTRSRKPFWEFKGLKGGSNNWTVHGSKTATGNPLMANDPHLGLDSPHKFWYVHLNTERAGGDLNVQGLALAGTPGVLLGYNSHVAWGLTTAVYDVEDVYEEIITPGQNGDPDTVEHNGQQVPIETITETIKRAAFDDLVVEFKNVPHHGLIIPGSESPDGTRALTSRWKGIEPSNEIGAVLGMMKARNVDDIETALDNFKVGAQCWNTITRDGDIYWSSASDLPVRPAAALTYDPETRTGLSPAFVLPGTGEYDWTGEYVSDRYVPHALNPDKGYIATANADPAGLSADGNPFNDDHYIGWDWDLAHRAARIMSVLAELTGRGGVTVDEMKQLQGDKRSPLGAKLAASLVAAVDRAQEEQGSPGTHPDLTAVVTDAGAGFAKLVAMRDKLAGWSFDTHPAVEGEPTQAEIDDSIATTIFNATIPRLVRLAFMDEIDRIGPRPPDDMIGKTLQWALLQPDRLNTYDPVKQDTVLWDDLETDAVEETRDERILRAMLDALAFLEEELGADMNEWRWGKLHRVKFDDLTGMDDSFTIPSPQSDYPEGYPRHGDNFGVDASHTGIWDTEDFTYGSGPQQRVVVEMTPDGPKIWNAIPGGQVHAVDDPHHADEAELWRKNEAPPLYFTEEDVVKNAESRIRFLP